MTTILGIESSCDETAAAVVDDGLTIRSNIIASQHDLHARFGGVVPEIASRAHVERILPTIEEALDAAGATLSDIHAIAVGHRPGLIGSLLVGVSAAKTLAWALDRPLIGVDHVQAHLYAAAMCAQAANPDLPAPYPALGLVVSGGHSSLYHVDSPTDMHILGRTIDDAVGEAYDKAAVILGLPYPGGPNVDKAAQRGDPSTFTLPRSLLEPESLDFSFSGLKTALLYKVRGHPQGRDARGRVKFDHSADELTDAQRDNLAASFQEAAIDVVIQKLRRARDAMHVNGAPPRSILIGGGVSANSALRSRAAQLSEELAIAVHVPPMKLCLDNAAMIAGLAAPLLTERRTADLSLPALATSAV